MNPTNNTTKEAGMDSKTALPTSVKDTLYVVMDRNYMGEPFFYISSIEPSAGSSRIIVESFEVERPIPAAFNPVAAEVEMLRAKLGKAADEYYAERMEIECRINDLLCLEAPQEAQ